MMYFFRFFMEEFVEWKEQKSFFWECTILMQQRRRVFRFLLSMSSVKRKANTSGNVARKKTVRRHVTIAYENESVEKKHSSTVDTRHTHIRYIVLFLFNPFACPSPILGHNERWNKIHSSHLGFLGRQMVWPWPTNYYCDCCFVFFLKKKKICKFTFLNFISATNLFSIVAVIENQ